MTDHPCEALPFNDRMVCGGCSLTWQRKTEAPPCKDAADPPIGLETIRTVMEAEAEKIEASQRALVEWREQAIAEGKTVTAAALRNAPHMAALNRAAVLRAGARLVERIQGDALVKERLKRGGAP